MGKYWDPENDRWDWDPATPNPLLAEVTAVLPEDVKEFLARWTPTPTNQICKCAGDDICLPHQATHLVRTLAGLV